MNSTSETMTSLPGVSELNTTMSDRGSNLEGVGRHWTESRFRHIREVGQHGTTYKSRHSQLELHDLLFSATVRTPQHGSGQLNRTKLIFEWLRVSISCQGRIEREHWWEHKSWAPKSKDPPRLKQYCFWKCKIELTKSFIDSLGRLFSKMMESDHWIHEFFFLKSENIRYNLRSNSLQYPIASSSGTTSC